METTLALSGGRPSWRRRHAALAGWLEALPFVGPTLIGFSVFVLGPVLGAFTIGLTKWDLLTPPQWVGLRNYGLMIQSPLFWRVVRNTLYYMLLYVPGAVLLSLLVALVVNRSLRGMTLYRGIFFLPVVISTVAVALVWMWFYQPEFGLVNYFLGRIGIEGPRWIASPDWAMPALVVMSVWKILGYNMVLFLAGLQGIPEEYYEAAAIDGASRWRQFLHITVPLISPTTFFVLVISIINSFQVFEQTYVLTQGGPAYSTLTLALYIYQQAFQFQKMGFAAALAYALFMMTLVVTLIQFAIQRKWVFYS